MRPMKPASLFERTLREANYASLDEARRGIVSQPYLADYVIDALIQRGILRLHPDGSVVGVTRGQSVPAAAQGRTEWRDNWAPRDVLVSWLRWPEDDDAPEGVRVKDWQGIPLRELQEKLRDVDGVSSGHWVTLHALWFLIEEGVAEKAGKGYRLTVAEEDRLAKLHRDQQEILNTAIRRMGSPVDAKRFLQELKRIPGHEHWLEDGEDRYTQECVESMVKARGEQGLV